MAINNPMFSSVPVSQTEKVCIQVLQRRPDVSQPIIGGDYPGRLAGFYNSSTQRVELYVVAGGGTYWVKVG